RDFHYTLTFFFNDVTRILSIKFASKYSPYKYALGVANKEILLNIKKRTEEIEQQVRDAYGIKSNAELNI
ncbi:MAG: hypothetical protein ACP5IV_07915, partial [Caldisericia bacterium]